jgi:glucose/arabinose dehydrogenase
MAGMFEAMKMVIKLFLPFLFLVLGIPASVAGQLFESEQHAFSAEIVVDELNWPWGMAFLPDGGILVTERSGQLRIIKDGKLQARPIAGLPEVHTVGQGGMLDVALHPDFSRNRWIYLSFVGAGEGGYGTEVVRGKLEGGVLSEVEHVFRALPKKGGGRHFGSRLLFAPDGTLYITLGERGDRDSAQQLDQHPGSLVRVNDDGSVPADNPFIGQRGTRAEIYTIGNRNMQGIALHPETRQVWTHEHGPQGGDEVNIMRAGANYGWPVISYGVNYGSGTKIGEGTEKAGMEQPIHYWVPSIAPSGMAFYTADKFSRWQGNLFVGSLKFGELVRLELDGNRVVHEERMLNDALGGIRDVRQGPDGLLYLLTNSRDGRLIRLRPAD